MSQVSRSNRAVLFISAFESSKSNPTGLRPGDVLLVEAVGLAVLEMMGEEVHGFANLRVTSGGRVDHRVTLTHQECVFDPEYDDSFDSDHIERLAEAFDTSAEDVVARLKRVGLIQD